jgi:hypothetical protein
MGDIKESIEVRRCHDNDKYIIKRVLVEEVNGKQVCSIYDEIEKAIIDTQSQLDDIPKQVVIREKSLRKQLEELLTRKEGFESHARKLKPVIDKEDATEKNALDGGP